MTTILVDALQVPSQFSGVGRQVLSLGRELHRLPEELELEVRCPADVRPIIEPAFPSRTRFKTPLPRSRPRIIRIAYQQLVAPARDGESVLLVCFGDQGPVRGRASVLLVVNDLRRIRHPGTSGGLESAYYRFLVPRAVRHASSVVTISEFSRNQIRDALGVEARVVADHPPPQVDEPSTGASGPFVVVSALRPYKGIETAIDALARLPAGTRHELVLVGTDEGRGEELRRYARSRGVADSVHLLGWLSDERLRDLYGSAVATVNPSIYEGYGLPVAESLSYGVPTIASEIPPHREVGGDAALYFRPGDGADLAVAMQRVVEDAALQSTLADRALARSRELAALGPKWADVVLDAVRALQSAREA